QRRAPLAAEQRACGQRRPGRHGWPPAFAAAAEIRERRVVGTYPAPWKAAAASGSPAAPSTMSRPVNIPAVEGAKRMFTVQDSPPARVRPLHPSPTAVKTEGAATTTSIGEGAVPPDRKSTRLNSS